MKIKRKLTIPLYRCILVTVHISCKDKTKESLRNKEMKIIKQIGIIFTVCWLSQVIADFLPFDFPASVIGMIFLFLCLLTGILKIEHIQEKSDFLLGNMAFFFVPAGVSIMNYFDLLKSSAVRLLIICVVSTVITFAVTAFSVTFTIKLMNRGKK